MPMNYLSDEAAATYFEISRRSHVLQILSWDQLFARLIALTLMCRPTDLTLKHVQVLIQLEPDAPREDWPDVGQDGAAAKGSTNDEQSFQEGDDDVILHFIPGGNTGLSDWAFHPLDVDFFPSVPHGHFENKPNPKLDAYLGWVYQGSRQIRREPRAHIVALWNDNKFRAMASTAIKFYLTTFPGYSGWRVANPRILPRRRRP